MTILFMSLILPIQQIFHKVNELTVFIPFAVILLYLTNESPLQILLLVCLSAFLSLYKVKDFNDDYIETIKVIAKFVILITLFQRTINSSLKFKLIYGEISISTIFLTCLKQILNQNIILIIILSVFQIFDRMSLDILVFLLSLQFFYSCINYLIQQPIKQLNTRESVIISAVNVSQIICDEYYSNVSNKFNNLTDTMIIMQIMKQLQKMLFTYKDIELNRQIEQNLSKVIHQIGQNHLWNQSENISINTVSYDFLYYVLVSTIKRLSKESASDLIQLQGKFDKLNVELIQNINVQTEGQQEEQIQLNANEAYGLNNDNISFEEQDQQQQVPEVIGQNKLSRLLLIKLFIIGQITFDDIFKNNARNKIQVYLNEKKENQQKRNETLQKRIKSILTLKFLQDRIQYRISINLDQMLLNNSNYIIQKIQVYKIPGISSLMKAILIDVFHFFQKISEQEYSEQQYTRPDIQFVSAQITPEKQTVELNLQPFEGVIINQISMSSKNFSKSTHIIELQYGPQFEVKTVIARLTGSVYESQLVNLTIPAQPVEQNICFVLMGSDDKIGAVDLICSLFVDEDLYQRFNENQNEEEFEEESSCDSCKDVKDGSEKEMKQSDEKRSESDENQSDKEIFQNLNKMSNQIDSDAVINSSKSQQQQQQQQTKQQTKQQSKQEETNKWRLYKGMKILDKQIGRGEPCKVGQTVSMRYILHLNDENGKIIDQSGKKPFTFKLGRNDVIRGWELGIPGMKIGGKRQLIIPPQLGYGNQGTDGIPPRTNLFFEVELVNKRD